MAISWCFVAFSGTGDKGSRVWQLALRTIYEVEMEDSAEWLGQQAKCNEMARKEKYLQGRQEEWKQGGDEYDQDGNNNLGAATWPANTSLFTGHYHGYNNYPKRTHAMEMHKPIQSHKSHFKHPQNCVRIIPAKREKFNSWKYSHKNGQISPSCQNCRSTSELTSKDPKEFTSQAFSQLLASTKWPTLFDVERFPHRKECADKIWPKVYSERITRRRSELVLDEDVSTIRIEDKSEILFDQRLVS